LAFWLFKQKTKKEENFINEDYLSKRKISPRGYHTWCYPSGGFIYQVMGCGCFAVQFRLDASCEASEGACAASPGTRAYRLTRSTDPA